MHTRRTVTAAGIAGLALVATATSAQAARPGCEGVIIHKATLVTDAGEGGVLDAGDVFTVTFQKPISGINAPSSVIELRGGDGEVDYLSHPNAEFDFTPDGHTKPVRTITVTVNDIDLGGFPVEIALPLPVTITSFSGVHDRHGNELDRRVSGCSKDATLS